jgi:hypothetical protein
VEIEELSEAEPDIPFSLAKNVPQHVRLSGALGGLCVSALLGLAPSGVLSNGALLGLAPSGVLSDGALLGLAPSGVLSDGALLL